jgi:hypothetical protein
LELSPVSSAAAPSPRSLGPPSPQRSSRGPAAAEKPKTVIDSEGRRLKVPCWVGAPYLRMCMVVVVADADVQECFDCACCVCVCVVSRLSRTLALTCGETCG